MGDEKKICTVLSYEDLSPEEQENASDNGSGEAPDGN